MNAEVDALVREEWRKAMYPHIQPATFNEWLDDLTVPGWDEVRAEIAAIGAILEALAARPAAPPVGEAERLVAGLEDMRHGRVQSLAEIDAALRAPAAGAPPDLVALVQEWQRTYRAYFNAPHPVVEARHKEYIAAFDLLLAWSPAPAPVAPPAETFKPPMGVCQWLDDTGDYTTECGRVWQFIDGDVALNDAKFCPFCGGKIQVVDDPPAVAGGDAPPECPECDGDGYTEIGPIGDNFAMYQEACRACRATGRRRQEGQ